MKNLCLFASVSRLIWASELIKDMTNMNIRSEVQQQLECVPYYIPNKSLGGYKDFGKKFLTLKTPESRGEANDFSIKLRCFINSITPKIWELDDCHPSEQSPPLLTDIMKNFEEFKCQALRRFLIYGLLFRFSDIQQLYECEKEPWRRIGAKVVDILSSINQFIPEIYYEDGGSLKDAVEFAQEMNKFVAFAWKIDFVPLYEILKTINYASIRNPEPLKILIQNGEYSSAIKMIFVKEASLNPQVNLAAWMALVVEAPETRNKINFIKTLISLDLFNVNWQIDQGEGIQKGDLVTVALNSKSEHYETIMLVLSTDENRLKRSLSFYLDYATDPFVSDNHSKVYINKLVSSIRDLIVKTPSSETASIQD